MNIGKYDITVKDTAYAVFAALFALMTLMMMFTLYIILFVDPIVSGCGKVFYSVVLIVLSIMSAHVAVLQFSIGFRVTKRNNPLL